MTKQEFNNWNEKAMTGEIADDLNPAFILSNIPTSLLSQIVKGEINVKELAMRTLEGRGQDTDGKWIGFEY